MAPSQAARTSSQNSLPGPPIPTKQGVPDQEALLRQVGMSNGMAMQGNPQMPQMGPVGMPPVNPGAQDMAPVPNYAGQSNQISMANSGPQSPHSQGQGAAPPQQIMAQLHALIQMMAMQQGGGQGHVAGSPAQGMSPLNGMSGQLQNQNDVSQINGQNPQMGNNATQVMQMLAQLGITPGGASGVGGAPQFQVDHEGLPITGPQQMQQPTIDGDPLTQHILQGMLGRLGMATDPQSNYDQYMQQLQTAGQVPGGMNAANAQGMLDPSQFMNQNITPPGPGGNQQMQAPAGPQAPSARQKGMSSGTPPNAGVPYGR